MNEDFNKNLPRIAERLRQIRKALLLSQDKIAAATGFSKSLISEAETGRKKPSAIYLFGLLDLYRVNINYIFTGEGDMFLGGPGGAAGDKEMREMIDMMNQVSHVRFTVLSFFIDFKTRNKDVIDKLIADSGKETGQ